MQNNIWVLFFMTFTASTFVLAQMTGEAEAPIITPTPDSYSNSATEQTSASKLETGEPQDPELDSEDKDFVEYEPAYEDQITADDVVSLPIDI